MESNNAYVAECKKNGKIAHALMCVKPEYSCAYIEKEVREKGFSGFKPYPDMVSGQKGADISIFQFWPHEQIALAERLGLPVVLHLPRPGRMADENNIRELLEIRRKYPNLKLIIAHFGRCFMTPYFCSALDQLGEDAGWFYYDTAAVMNPEVLRIGLEGLPHDHILFGMDQPIFLWHGYRRWTDSTYENVVRERLPWCKGHESADKEEKYTLFIYEQMNNILNTIEAVGGGSELVEMIFHGNAEHVFSCK